MNTVLYEYFGEEGIVSDEEFKKEVPNLLEDLGSRGSNLVDLANSKNLGARVFHTARLGGDRIPRLDDVKAFIICRQYTPDRFHVVAMVRPEGKKRFYLSDSGDQREDAVYPAIQPVTQEGVPRTATATEAFLDYQNRNNLTARSVITFHERIWANGPEYGVNRFRV